MDTNALFAAALALADPWYVAAVTLEPTERRLDITIDFRRGGTFPCPDCSAPGCKAYDSEERRWRHLDFFQYRTEVTARTPRVRCAQCGVHPVAVPWARPGSGFTLFFEALVMAMAPLMPVAAMARLLAEHDSRLWRLVHHHVEDARAARDDRAVTAVGIDETSLRRGHDYVSLFVDLERRQLLFATPGKDAPTVDRFAADLTAHGGTPEQIAEVCCDMSPAFIKGVGAALPEAQITFDKFHLVQLVNTAVDETRRTEQASSPALKAILKGQRYAWLRNPETMSDEQLGFVAEHLQRSRTLQTARAFHLKLVFQEAFLQPQQAAAAYLRRWCAWAQRVDSRRW